jgi:hypothetical protein
MIMTAEPSWVDQQLERMDPRVIHAAWAEFATEQVAWYEAKLGRVRELLGDRYDGMHTCAGSDRCTACDIAAILDEP